MQAVYAVAYALHDLNEKNKIVSRNGQLSFNYTELIEALYRVNFSRDNLRVKFTKDGDLDNATMAIHSYHKEEENGNIYTKDTLVGYWHENGTTANDRFQLDYNKIVWKFGSKPVSVCNALCSPGTRVVYGPSKCCWSCEPCTTHEYSNETHSEKCYKCQDHTHANIQKSKCVDNWERWICLQDGIGITSLVFAGIGWAAVLISTVVVVINRTHRCLQSETTLKAITLLSCLFGYFNVVFWIVQPTDTNCTIRRLGLLLIAMTHCLRVFFISPIGRLLATRTATYLHLNQRFAVEISFSLHLLVAGLIHYGLIYPFPFNVFKSDVFGSDDVNGEKIVSFLDCHFDNQVNTAIILIISILHPTIYWLSAVISCYRGREKAPKRQRISSGTPPTVTVDDNRLVLFVSYFVSLVILATLPIYATSTDPYLHNFILLVVVFVCNSLVLLFFIAPRLYKIYFKREFAAMGHLFFVDTSISAK